MTFPTKNTDEYQNTGGPSRDLKMERVWTSQNGHMNSKLDTFLKRKVWIKAVRQDSTFETIVEFLIVLCISR